MSYHDRRDTHHLPAHGETGVTARPERLVLTGLRCWMAGYETADAACWEVAWNEYARELGGRAAKPVITELACWVRSIRQISCRGLAFYPWCCRHSTEDEALAVSMVAECQHGRVAAARGAAFLLLATNTLDPVVNASVDFASALTDAGLRLGAGGNPAFAGRTRAEDGGVSH
jgi:hypothetical protein